MPMRINLNCPYAEKDEAKKLGARWDPEKRVWYVVDPEDLSKFGRWIDANWVKSGKRPKAAETAKAAKTAKKVWPKTEMNARFKEFICGCKVLPWEDCVHTLGEKNGKQANQRDVAIQLGRDQSPVDLVGYASFFPIGRHD